jgi:predicted metalloprotease with PDZ domain
VIKILPCFLFAFSVLFSSFAVRQLAAQAPAAATPSEAESRAVETRATGEADAATTRMEITIDARELPRKLLRATLNIHFNEAVEEASLWYPKWVPGSHAPGGPLANVAGMKFCDDRGQVLAWTREPGEPFLLNVASPGGTKRLDVELLYISDQPTTNSMGHDVFGSPHLGIISPGCVLLYPDGANIDELLIDSQLKLPNGWVASSALQNSEPETADSKVAYTAATLRTFVDSPIMCGRFRTIYDLQPTDCPVPVVPHRLHVFGDSDEGAGLPQELIQVFSEMVRQTAILTGSQPFDRFEILLAATRNLPSNGLEHSRSTMNVLPPEALRSVASLKGWNRLLIPHEYLHAWCGKYRRPDRMATTDFHTPKGTELLWVYEGLTQYLGELIEARCGLMNKDEFRHRVSVELRNAYHQHNRQWRSLDDTAAASMMLRDGSRSWSRHRGGQDYYMEGMLFWLEVDGLLRQMTQGEKSLDDFCAVFFAADEPATAVKSVPKAFDRTEIVRILDSLLPYDWDGLIRRRVESPQQVFEPKLAEVLGYRFEPLAERPSIPAGTFRFRGGLDEYDSIGAIIAEDGTVLEIMLGSAADRGRLDPGIKIIGIAGYTFNSRRLRQAIRQAADTKEPIELLVVVGEQLKPLHLQYYDGPRYLAMVRHATAPDLLESILESRN